MQIWWMYVELQKGSPPRENPSHPPKNAVHFWITFNSTYYSWREYINEDCMTDASDPSCSMPFSPYEKIEEPCLQMTNL